MNFQESLEYLLNLGNEVLAMKLGLASTETLLVAIGNPERNFLKIQVAGTNGKGSTCAFLDAICRNAQIKTGLFTSPHLISITERIKIGGAEISETDFARHATKIKEISETLVGEKKLEAVPTFFEQMTAIAVSAFAEAQIELAILETGLGGRFDSVTATRAEIVAITPIDYDHQQILGNTLPEIAAEKAAIIRANSKVVISEQKKEALEVILNKCRQENVAPVLNKCRIVEENPNEYFFLTYDKSYFVNNLGLNGEHQFQNACVAVDVAEILIEEFNFEISNFAVEEGLANAKHKGRLEWYEYENEKILFDGAHNASGAAALKTYLEKYQKESQITVVFGAMKDKDLTEISEILFPVAENLILTMPESPRSETPENLREIAKKVINESKIFTVSNVSDALWSAFEFTKNYSALKPSFILITGSLYLVGEAQKLLNNKSEI
jgi:dihydrofolate synthase/folylpolyglutamate synthase